MSQTIYATEPADRMRLVAVSTEVLDVDGIDARDRDLIWTHTRRYWAQEDPRPAVGDIVRLDWAGINAVRIAHLWRDGQFQPPCGGGRFHLQADALRYGGGLDLPRPTRHLALLSKPEWARCWIYHHGIAQPHHALDVEIPRRVWIYDQDFAS